MDSFYYELDVEGVMQCPVCYELPPKDIYLCKVGHHMCDKCKQRLPSCPTCQAALTNARNFVAEALISKFSIFKVDDDLSNVRNIQPPKVVIRPNINILPKLMTPPGLYSCLLEGCRPHEGHEGHERLGINDLIKHLKTVHKHLFDKFKNKLATFSHNFGGFCFMKSKELHHRAFEVSNMGVFFLNMKLLDKSIINCWISMAGPIKLAKRFKYMIEFSKEDDNMELSFVNVVASNSQEGGWLAERGGVIVIPQSTHRLEEGQFFSLRVKIVYKSPN